MNKRLQWIVKVTLAVAFIFLFACGNKKSTSQNLVSKNLDFATEQIALLLQVAEDHGNIPRSLKEDGSIEWKRKNFDWTEGFFPGTCWYLYEYSNDEKFKSGALVLQSTFEDHKYLTSNHDLGFVFNNSFGKAYRVTNNAKYKAVMVQAAKSLCERFNPNVGCIQSWDVSGGWQAKRGWQYPVIIDNMMNLELLFEASLVTSNDYYKTIAITHANTTLKNHFRPDGSSYHVVDYDSIDGAVRKKETAQGYAHESAWARGQAWGLYGYTMCYRYTKNQQFLDKALEIASFLFQHENMPNDLVPYWDFNAPNIPDELRDASAAAVIASALIELDGYSNTDYKTTAINILTSLSSEKYQAAFGKNGNYILKHSVGSIPHGAELDVPLNYADYYYVEALMRLKNKE